MSSEFGLCYHCEENDHAACVGVPCDCECPTPDEQPRSPKCGNCDNPAACLGSGEGAPESYACDDCCGHGNEDGWCVPLADIPERWTRLRTRVEALEAERAKLVAVVKAADYLRREACCHTHSAPDALDGYDSTRNALGDLQS